MCKRQYASLETQRDGLEGYPVVLLQDEATGPVGCQGRGRTRKWRGGQKTGTLEAHTKKTIYGLKTKKPCSLSHGMHIHDQLWRADMFPVHFKPVFSRLELDIEKQPEVVTFPFPRQLRYTKGTVSSTCAPSRHLLASGEQGSRGQEARRQVARELVYQRRWWVVGETVAVGEKARFKRNVEERMDKMCVSVSLWRREFHHSCLRGR